MEETTTAMLSRSLIRQLCLLCTVNDDETGASEESEKPNGDANSEDESGSGNASLTVMVLVGLLFVLLCCVSLLSSSSRYSDRIGTTDDKDPSVSPEERLKYVTNALQIEIYSNENGSDTGESIISTGSENDDLETGRRSSKVHCAICLQGFQDGQAISRSDNCDHRFCKDCITQWLLKKDQCPYCRQEYLKRCKSAGRIQSPSTKADATMESSVDEGNEEARNQRESTINDEREGAETDSISV